MHMLIRPLPSGGAFLSLYMFRFLVVLVKISTIQHLNFSVMFRFLVVLVKISTIQHLNCKQLIQCHLMSRFVAQCPGALRNAKKCKFSFVNQCLGMHWHKWRGRQLLLAKVRMLIGRIGIFLWQSLCCLLEEILATRYMKLTRATAVKALPNMALRVGGEGSMSRIQFIQPTDPRNFHKVTRNMNVFFQT